MRRAGTIASLVASLAILHASPLHGQSAEPGGNARLVSVLESPGKSPTLVGSSGQLYEPIGDMQWQRQHAGGVSVRVERVVRSAQGVLYAIGQRAPLFAFNEDRWASYSLAQRGEVHVSTGTLPVFSVRRTIYQLGASGFRKIATAKGNVARMWASSPSRLFVLSDDQTLWTGRGNSWRSVSLGLRADEKITKLVGISGKDAVALSSENRLFEVDAKKSTELAIAEGLRGMQVHAIAAVGNRILLAGVQSSETEQVSVLAEISKDGVQKIAGLWPLAAGDRFAILSRDAKDRLIVATRAGRLKVQDATGQWLEGQVHTRPPEGPPRAAGRAPALAQ